MGKSEDAVVLESLNKAYASGAPRPHLGGKDPMSQGMTNDAAMASKLPVPAASAGPKLSPEDQARRAAGLADFTAAGPYTAAGTGAAAGPMKPAAALPVQGKVAQPQGTSAHSVLARFQHAFHKGELCQTCGKEPCKCVKKGSGAVADVSTPVG